MNNKAILILLLASVVFTVGMMKFSSHGSFSPSDAGFYTSIGAGILWFLAMYFVFKKIVIRKSRKDKS